jgi:hypothetical protein
VAPEAAKHGGSGASFAGYTLQALHDGSNRVACIRPNNLNSRWREARQDYLH